MIELIQDGREQDVLVYTDDAKAAAKIRKKLQLRGATYHGDRQAYSWRIPKGVALASLKVLGLKIERNNSVDK